MTKILLVEDDKSLREIYGVRLAAEGYEIVSAGDGEEALAVAIKERPALIVSDVMMPKISGFDMLDILRSTTETRDIKVIMMTALSSDDQRARGEALGADRYLVKSQVGIEDVVRTVHEVLGDGIAPAPSFPPAAPVAAPVAEPAPQPQPVPEPPIAPAAQPVAPAPVEQLIPAPSAPEPQFQPTPAPTPAPAARPQPQEPVAPTAPVAEPAPTPLEPVTPAPAPATPAPVPQPFPPAPQPAAAPMTPPAPAEANPLPQPTAPFSTNRPASLGDRIINPISPAESLAGAPTNIALQMDQELSRDIPQPPQPPLPPAPTA